MINGFFDGLIISPETRKGGESLNASRQNIGESLIPIYEIDIINEKQGEGVGEDKLSSSFVRNYLIKKNELEE